MKVTDPRDERLYCHQHKDQARLAAAPAPARPQHGAIAEERSSLDTLAERLGLMKTNSVQQVRPSAQYQRPPRPAQKKSSSLWCCCFSIPLDFELEEQAPPPRPQPKPVQHQGRPSHLGPNSGVSQRPSSSSNQNVSQTAQFMSLIPHSASPETASLLMKELAKGFSTGDEAGYIYIFWLTPESDPATPPHEAAKALLTTNPRSRSTSRGRAASDALDRYATSYDDDDDAPRSRGRGGNGNGGGQKKNKKILLKIGRANNVQRRLNEWQRQCGYNISLIRYYPYVSSSSTSDVMRKMPHSHKVERLIHIELQGRGLRVMDRGKCPSCGKEHKEWFEVDNTRAAVADIDEVVRRWSDWDETQQ